MPYTKDISTPQQRLPRLRAPTRPEISESYFCRKFKRITGITVTNYIKTQRLEHARRLLEKTEESVRHIAISCGFIDAAYFTNCFKAMYKISPTKYRNNYTNKKIKNLI